MAFELKTNNIILLVIAAALIWFFFFKDKKVEKFNAFNAFKPKPMACKLYEHANYKGKQTSIPPGKYNLFELRLKGMLNDSVSSLEIEPGFMVIAYEHDNFEGRHMIMTASTPYVGNDWNDTISSIIIVPFTSKAWNNCVAWNETAPGKHHDWCQNDFGKFSQHAGRDGAGCAKGWGKGVCQVPQL